MWITTRTSRRGVGNAVGGADGGTRQKDYKKTDSCLTGVTTVDWTVSQGAYPLEDPLDCQPYSKRANNEGIVIC
jgi:hypothetical protein